MTRVIRTLSLPLSSPFSPQIDRDITISDFTYRTMLSSSRCARTQKSGSSPFFAYTLFSLFNRDLIFPTALRNARHPSATHFAGGGQSPPKLDDEGSLAAVGESRILQNTPWHAPVVQTREAAYQKESLPLLPPPPSLQLLGVNDYGPVH